MMDEYLLQTRGTTCLLIAGVNARVFYGMEIPGLREGEPRFLELAERHKCINGGCLQWNRLFEELELGILEHAEPSPEWVRGELEAGRCVKLTISTPRANLHATLIVGYCGQLFECVNAQVHEPNVTLEWLDWEQLSAPPADAHRRLPRGCFSVFPLLG